MVNKVVLFHARVAWVLIFLVFVSHPTGQNCSNCLSPLEADWISGALFIQGYNQYLDRTMVEVEPFFRTWGQDMDQAWRSGLLQRQGYRNTFLSKHQKHPNETLSLTVKQQIASSRLETRVHWHTCCFWHGKGSPSSAKKVIKEQRKHEAYYSLLRKHAEHASCCSAYFDTLYITLLGWNTPRLLVYSQPIICVVFLAVQS